MYFFKSIFALGLAALGATSPVFNSTLEGRIIRGEYVEAYQAPFFCDLYTVNKYNELDYACGSTIIAEQTLLTSAECLRSGENYVAQCGSNTRLGSPLRALQVETFLRHPEFERTPGDKISNNIALAYLKEPAQCNDRIQFIELQTDHITEGGNYRIYGFGADEFPDGSSPVEPTYHLKQLDAQLYDVDACRKYFRNSLYFNEIPAGTFCASPKDPLATQCQMDQGGPLADTATERQVGIVSYVSPYCAIERPGLYTSVQYFLPWIIDNLRPSVYRTKVEKKKNRWH